MARPKMLKPKAKLNVELPAEVKKAITDIQLSQHMDGMSEVIRRAVLLLERVIEGDCHLYIDGKEVIIL